ncbi:lytic murein transglycosylase [Roseomonas nepalensis]|uniref:Lytic murein transglycosylase n=1 Tax=Muricoccus nepalensis TaxID=1854500 RepID=A0A502FUI6_9PROT|nr:lytic murein transglycosylase [Roseomonas nepalensis]TPG53114.1 lytic murein transglycosylase [Roseomonas nepalensis]
MKRPGRRSVVSLLAALPPSAATAQREGFDAFVEGVREEARRGGISPATLQQSLTGLRPLDRVIELDRRQPESTLAWETYRDRVLGQARIDAGRRAHADNRALLESLQDRFRVPGRVLVAIWGMETNYGASTGGFGVVEALATLAWEGRRAAYFRGELLAALRILDAGHVAPDRMRGSWAGAMGQPQFMPTSFERLAVDADGDGRKDIWDSRADALGSIANYLAVSGWQDGQRWGREARLPDGFDPAGAGRDTPRPLRDWAGMGLSYADGTAIAPGDESAALVVPGAATGSRQAFLVGENFRAIRRYNPSDFYALAVGLLSDRVA